MKYLVGSTDGHNEVELAMQLLDAADAYLWDWAKGMVVGRGAW